MDKIIKDLTLKPHIPKGSFKKPRKTKKLTPSLQFLNKKENINVIKKKRGPDLKPRKLRDPKPVRSKSVDNNIEEYKEDEVLSPPKNEQIKIKKPKKDKKKKLII